MAESAATSKKAKKKAIITIKREWCKSCGICVEMCPKNVLEMTNDYPEPVRPDDCILCMECELHCPDFAITVKEAGDEEEAG